MLINFEWQVVNNFGAATCDIKLLISKLLISLEWQVVLSKVWSGGIMSSGHASNSSNGDVLQVDMNVSIPTFINIIVNGVRQNHCIL